MSDPNDLGLDDFFDDEDLAGGTVTFPMEIAQPIIEASLEPSPIANAIEPKLKYYAYNTIITKEMLEMLKAEDEVWGPLARAALAKIDDEFIKRRNETGLILEHQDNPDHAPITDEEWDYYSYPLCRDFPIPDSEDGPWQPAPIYAALVDEAVKRDAAERWTQIVSVSAGQQEVSNKPRHNRRTLPYLMQRLRQVVKR